MVCLGFQLETALGHVADWQIVEGFGEPFTFLTKCGCCCFPSALLPSPELLFLTPHCQRGDSRPSSGEMSKLGKVWFPGPGPTSSRLWLTICGLLLSIRALQQQGQGQTPPHWPSSLGPRFRPGASTCVAWAGRGCADRAWETGSQSALGHLPAPSVGWRTCLTLRLPYVKAGTYVGGKPLETNKMPGGQAGGCE